VNRHATAAKTAKRQPRKKKVEEQKVATIALPALTDEHLHVPTLETWLWDAAGAIRDAADATKFKDFILPDICPCAAVVPVLPFWAPSDGGRGWCWRLSREGCTIERR
jgi:hypothetical protein